MKSFFAVILLLVALPLTACGFHPMYGERAIAATPSVQIALNSISIDNIPDRSGQLLRNILSDRFYKTGAPAMPRYRLKVSALNESIVGLDITVDEESTRNQLRATTSMTLTDTATHAVILNRPLYTIVSYNVLQSQFTTRIAEQNARENAIADIARQIEQAIVLKLTDGPE